MPAIVPAPLASSTTSWPRLAPGLSGLPGRLAVEAQVARGLLDQAVRLARDDEAVLGEADVERLAAAAQGEEHAVRRRRRVRADRDRALERRDRGPERLDDRLARVDPPAHERRDHLGVGGDLGRDRQVVQRDELGVVVDVAVERGGGVRTGADRPRPPPPGSAGARSPRR